MEIAGVSSGTQPLFEAATANVKSGSDIPKGMGKEAFLNLLIAQIRYQNPLDPIKNENFIAQLAQFSSLEAIQEIKTAIESQSRTQQLASAAGLVGREIEILGPDGKPLFGIVEAVEQLDDEVFLRVGQTLVGMDEVLSVI